MSAWFFFVPLPAIPLTPNHRKHPMARARVAGEVRRTTAVLARSERNRLHLAACEEPRHLRLTWVRTGRRGAHPLDQDAIPYALKPCLDALADAGWIRNDDATWLRSCEYGQRKGEGRVDRLEVDVWTADLQGIPAVLSEKQGAVA